MSNRAEQKALKETSQLLRGFATRSGEGGATRVDGGRGNKQEKREDL